MDLRALSDSLTKKKTSTFVSDKAWKVKIGLISQSTKIFYDTGRKKIRQTGCDDEDKKRKYKLSSQDKQTCR